MQLSLISGTAFAYADDDTSSDSDDEMQKQYRSAIQAAHSIKRSETSQSVRSGRSARRPVDKGMYVYIIIMSHYNTCLVPYHLCPLS